MNRLHFILQYVYLSKKVMGNKVTACIKVPYYGFLKMIFHPMCNTALSEWIHPAKF